jgi:hypothetical protein
MDGTCRTTARDKKCLKNFFREAPCVFVCVISWHCQDLDCIASSGRVMMNLKVFGRNKLIPDGDSIYPSTCLEQLKETMKNHSKDSRCASHNSDLGIEGRILLIWILRKLL